MGSSRLLGGMVMESCWIHKLKRGMKVCGKMICTMAWVNCLIWVKLIRDIFTMGSSQDMEHTSIQTGLSIRGIGKMVKNMDKE